MSIEAFISRLKEAIEDSAASQGTIADYCGVSRQSVTNWKTTGQISRDNLRRLSEVSGYRYIWLKEGLGAKRFTDPEENQKEAFDDEMGVRSPGASYGNTDDSMEDLIRSIRFAKANRKLTEDSVRALTAFFNSLVDAK